jgi:endonuclease G
MGGSMFPRLAGLATVFLFLVVTSARAQKTLTATEAKGHIGEQAIVCGKVVSTLFADTSRGQPTFLDFDQPYPNQIFAVVVWGSDRPKFGDPETVYRGKRICVTGKISAFKGVPEVVAQEPAQIQIKNQ